MTSIADHTDEFRLRQLIRDMDNAEKEGLAIQAALAEHSVTAYVKNLPAYPSLYPAIEYLKSTEVRKGQQENGSVQESVQEIPYRYHQYITWCLPAHDMERPSVKHCGFIRSSSGNSIVFSACPKDHEHYIKGKRRHCWSLRCPQCMNDTALKRGIAIEKKLLEYKKLREKRGEYVGELGHWAISPVQEFAKAMCQTKAEFDKLCTYIDDSLLSYGATAGMTIFHPWRQKEDHWEFSPHFHSLCYGRIDTNRFRKDNPGWIIKKVHSKEKIRSIRHTAAYLTTHMGLGQCEKDPDEVDWDLRFMDHMIPGLLSPGASYSEEDHNRMSEGKGRMVGDISDIDWIEWTEQQLFTEFKIRYWGGASKRNIRTLGVFRQYKIRVCKECGEILRTYDGFDDSIGSYIRYITDNPVVVFADDFENVKLVFQMFKARLREENKSIADFALSCPLAISSLELGLETNKDLIMANPFEEPDEYFLRRQKAAFGEEAE